jgi:hypothetical protein
MKRPLTGEGDDIDNEAMLIPGRLQAVAFAVWNGEKPLPCGMGKTKNVMDKKLWRLGCNCKLIP